jgi:hypothetical protein
MNKVLHSFHIPVMGTGYTIDSPLKVARFGIDSVVSIIDHRLIETMREYYSKLFNKDFIPIDDKEDDSRARRITAYLDFMDQTVKDQFDVLSNEKFEAGTEITKYFEMLPPSSPLSIEYEQMLNSTSERKEKEAALRKKMQTGSIDVNVMTKIDKVNLDSERRALPVEYNDAHAAIRGFVKSSINSSVVLSAGLNPRLYGYIAMFPEFFANKLGEFQKRIVLKVSDFRSAMVQGKFLAKKGLWISEFRIESGLNCGGHAFATEGYLLGSILKEFKVRKEELLSTLYDLYTNSLEALSLPIPQRPTTHFSAQGGVGNWEEQQLLLNEYDIDSVGWGSPFLLVPEAVNIDAETLQLLINSQEQDFYISDMSPLGVRFNTVKGTSAELGRQARIDAGRPGSPCYKEHLVANKEYTEEPICTASRQFQKKKIAALKTEIIDKDALQKAIQKVTEKTCLCVGLGNGALIDAKAKLYKGMTGVVVCPGPNLAYFSREVSLRQMVDHIYGRVNISTVENRPHMFVKELRMYVQFLKEKIEESSEIISQKQEAYFQSFSENLSDCIGYYNELIGSLPSRFESTSERVREELALLTGQLKSLPIHMKS